MGILDSLKSIVEGTIRKEAAKGINNAVNVSEYEVIRNVFGSYSIKPRAGFRISPP